MPPTIEAATQPWEPEDVGEAAPTASSSDLGTKRTREARDAPPDRDGSEAGTGSSAVSAVSGGGAAAGSRDEPVGSKSASPAGRASRSTNRQGSATSEPPTSPGGAAATSDVMPSAAGPSAGTLADLAPVAASLSRHASHRSPATDHEERVLRAQQMIDIAITNVHALHLDGRLRGDTETHFQDALLAELHGLGLTAVCEKRTGKGNVNDAIIDIAVFGIKEKATPAQQHDLACWPKGNILLELKATRSKGVKDNWVEQALKYPRIEQRRSVVVAGAALVVFSQHKSKDRTPSTRWFKPSEWA